MKSGIAHILFAIIFLSVGTGVYSQVLQTARYEHIQKFNGEDFYVYGLKKDGIVLFRESGDFKEGKALWQVIWLDTLLNEKADITVPVPSRFNLVGYENSSSTFHMLFQEGEYTKELFTLISVNLNDSAITFDEIHPEIEIDLSHFIKAGNNMVFGGYLLSHPTVLLFNIKSKLLKVLPGFVQEESDLMDIQLNDNETFNVITMEKSQKEDRQLIFRTYDETGRMLIEDKAVIGTERTLLTGISSKLIRDDMMVVGTWAYKNSKQALGFYTMPINPYKNDPVKYYYLGELEHALEFMKPSRVERIKEKTLKAKKDDQFPDYTNYIQPVVMTENDNGYFLLAEIYLPLQNASPTAPYSYSSSPYYSSPYWGGYSPPFGRPYYPLSIENKGYSTSSLII